MQIAIIQTEAADFVKILKPIAHDCKGCGNVLKG